MGTRRRAAAHALAVARSARWCSGGPRRAPARPRWRACSRKRPICISFRFPRCSPASRISRKCSRGAGAAGDRAGGTLLGFVDGIHRFNPSPAGSVPAGDGGRHHRAWSAPPPRTRLSSFNAPLLAGARALMFKPLGADAIRQLLGARRGDRVIGIPAARRGGARVAHPPRQTATVAARPDARRGGLAREPAG